MMATLFSSKRFSRLALAAALILVETFIVAARPPALVQGGLGTIEGTVVQADSGLPISNAQVTLSGGGIKPQNLESLAQQLTESTFMPPEMTINGVRGYYANTRGLPQPQVQEATMKMMTEGIGPSRENGALEDGILQAIMRNANVNLGTSPYNSEFVSAIRNFRAANAQFKIVTDRSGRFTFRDVPEGQYTVRVERDGYYGQSGGAVPQTGTASVAVSARGVANATVAMVRGSTISGRLRDNDGLPMAHATVQAFVVAYSNGVPALRAAASARTNDRGEYSIFWLPAGEYIIATVRDATQVVGGYLLQQVVGTFYPGTPLVTQAVPVNLKANENREGLDFIHRVSKPVRVSGTITTTLPAPPPPAVPAGATAPAVNPNQSRPAALMLLLRDTTAPDDIGARTIAQIPVPVAQGSVKFEVDIPQPGSYDLYARMPARGGPTQVSFGRVSFDIRDENIKDLVVKIDPVLPLSGTVTVNGSAPGQNSLRISMQVDDSGAKLPAYGVQIRSRMVPVEPSGAYTLPGVFVGHWQVYIEGLTPEMYVADVRQGGGSVFDSGITITGEQPTPLQVSIQTDSGTIEGSVLDAGRRPVAGASVVLVPPEHRRQNRLLYRAATSTADGRFTIKGVAPGSYKIFSWPGGDAGLFAAPIDAAYYNARFMSRYEIRGQSISIAKSAVANVDITVIPRD